MTPPFLDPDEIRRNCVEAALSAEVTEEFVDFAARVLATPVWQGAARAMYHRVFETCDDLSDANPHVNAVFGNDARLLRGLIVLDSIRLIREKQGARGVPPDVIRAVTEHQPIGALRDYAEENRRAGVGDWIWWWYRTVGSGDLYGLGRLELIPKPWDCPFRVFVNDATNETVSLLDAGQTFTDDGYMLGPPTWTSTLSESENAIIGHAISPRGYAVRTPVRLPRADWRQTLGPGDRVLDMHIPGDSPLTLDSIQDALCQAGPFFDRFYPDQPFTAYVCDSWLFSTQIEGMLPPESNILRWQREGYLFPNDSGGEWFLNFVFHSPTIDLATAPRDTRLRRAAIAHLEQGNQLRCGGYFLLRRDLPRFGTQPYRIASERAIARLAQR